MNGRSDRAASLRRLPSTDRLVNAVVRPADAAGRRRLATSLARDLLQRARLEAERTGDVPEAQQLAARLAHALGLAEASSLRRVVNATGVIVHTNLGRALLSRDAIAAVATAAASYTTLEYDLESGQRSSRYMHARGLLRHLTGAEDAIVVNNNAAAVMLTLAALCREREVVVSRGQLVEIGGGFRIPEILAQSGARLVEVGTTNRTYARDYERAISADTAALLRVHPSNFRMRGFTHEAELRELAALARDRGVLLVDDLGSGSLLDTTPFGLEHEPMVQESVAAGAHAICFSGDKLLGGPQAGIVVGTRGVIATVEGHPLTRALRVDKLTLAALEATLRHYVASEATEAIPVWRMIAEPEPRLRERAVALAARLTGAGVPASVVEGRSMIGGGSLPEESLPTWLVGLSPGAGSPTELAARLRRADPPVVARIASDQVLCDLRTVLPEQEEELATALEQALGGDGRMGNGGD